MTLKDLVIKYRADNGLSQRQFALQCGLSNGYISMLEKGINPSTGAKITPTLQALNKLAAGTVNAKAQSDAAVKIMDVLTEEEQSIFRRGRNAKPGTTPKNMSVRDYHRATGLEALLGYLYLTGEDERIEELITMIMDGNSIG